MYQYYNKQITSFSDLDKNDIFVFGSNLAGRHGAGAALFAKSKLGAKTGTGHGFTGNCYAIPTKDRRVKTLPLGDITVYVELFVSLAAILNDKTYYVTKIGCGLAGYKDSDIAPLFKGSPSNCKFHEDWRKYLDEDI